MKEIISKRIQAYLIDCIIISIPLYLCMLILWETLIKKYPDKLLFIAIFIQLVPFILYFFISEFLFSKTLGKKILKLKVVYTTNNRFIAVLIRTFARFIPLDILSFIFMNNNTFHDLLSKSTVEFDK